MISAVILAGGGGTRFGSHVPKALMSLNGKPVIQYSIDVIDPFVNELIVVVAEPYRDYRHVTPGQTRGQSVFNGVSRARYDKVLIHDGVRPFLTRQIVRDVITAVAKHPSVDTAVPIVDGYLEFGLPMSKEGRWLGQTPEAFDRNCLFDAFSKATREYDDEVGMVYDVLGIQPTVVEGVQVNSKITFAKDLENAEGMLKFWCEPITEASNKIGHVLVLGGSGGIGTAILGMLPSAVAPTRAEVDLAGEFDIDLSPYAAIVHVAGDYDKQIMAVNFDSILRLVGLALSQGWSGNIVVFSSTAATYGRQGMPVYSASKAALNAWIEASHEQLAGQGIFLNAIAPAKVDTRLQRALNPSADPDEMMRPDYVALRTLPYLHTDAHGHIVYLRVGFDDR